MVHISILCPVSSGSVLLTSSHAVRSASVLLQEPEVRAQ